MLNSHSRLVQHTLMVGRDPIEVGGEHDGVAAGDSATVRFSDGGSARILASFDM